jgi:hypothetical protein
MHFGAGGVRPLRFTVCDRLETSLDTDDGGQNFLDHVTIRGRFLRYGGGRFDLSLEIGNTENGANQNGDSEANTNKALSSHGV